ncbi:MAG: cytochrome P450 [Acidimicrobiia bacterium]|nr:cytochrome P450 [Acidimicrobiia bacterium]
MATVDLYDPGTYEFDSPHEEFARLRRVDPVHWQDMPGEPGYWAVLRHADVVHVARNPLLFSCEAGGVVPEDLDPERLARMRDMLLSMDPPRHIAYRKPLAPEFAARIIAGMEEQIRAITREILAESRQRGEVEFVHETVGALPTQVIGRLFGLPESDWEMLHEWSQLNTSAQDPEINPDGDNHEAGSADSSMRMAIYGMQFAADRRTVGPQGDLMDIILGQQFDGRYLTDGDIGSLLVQMITAGNDTTVTMMAGGVWALLQHPDQLRLLREDRALIPGAVEEMLRWYNPLHYFRRTATADTEIAGTRIAAGDKVAMYYTSANRDEEVFADSQRFDVTRSPNPHLSFGIGEHFCLGVHLARLEGRVFFEELLDTFSVIEPTGDAVRVRSNLNNALKRLPLRLVA